MQLKQVVLPAPLGPMRPTISNSSTSKATSSSACRPPKRIDRSMASRTGIGLFGARPAAGVQLEALTLEPTTDGRSDRAQAFRLEDHGENGEHARQRRDDEDGVVLEEADRLPPIRQVFAS